MMAITERRIDDVSILALEGRLILSEGEVEFRHYVDDLVSHDRLKILVDLKDVTYIDSAGIGAMVGKYLSVRRKGGDIKLLHLGARSRRVMTITKLLTVFEAYESEDQALRSFAGTH
jgi:anti-sigma B factor antagonist